MLRTLIVLCLGAIIAIVVIERTHPILFKWLTGNARYIGKSINATVYTDGNISNKIKVYRNNYLPDDYLLALSEPDGDGMLKYINLNLDKKWVGRPVSTNIRNYDVINESLYQSNVGAHFTDFRDDMKGFNFDPHLHHSGDTIKFNAPPGRLKFNTVLIVLPAQ